MKTIVSRAGFTSTCFKVSNSMYEFLCSLVKDGYMWSISEGMRFALLVYIQSNPNPKLHLPRYFSNTFYLNKETKKRSISVKILPKLNKRLKMLCEQYHINRSEVLRLAIDYTSEYFIENPELHIRLP